MAQAKNNNPSPNGTIGPHDGCELDLMLTGTKKLALFFAPEEEGAILPRDKFNPYVDKGMITKEEIEIDPVSDLFPGSLSLLLYCLPGYEDRIKRAINVLVPILTCLRKPTDRDDVDIGQLLGYSDEDIKVFLQSRNSGVLE